MVLHPSRAPWLVVLFAAMNLGACAALAEAGLGGQGGGGGSQAGGGNGGGIDYDAGTGGSTTGDYSYLCGDPTCDVTRSGAIPSCATGGTGGSSGGTGGSAGGATGGAGGTTTTTGGAGGSTMTPTGGTGGSTGTGGSGGSTIPTGGAGGSPSTGGSGGSTTTSTGGAGAGGGGGALPGEPECKLVFDLDGVARSCVPSGNAAEFAPCATAADCGPGLGCVLLGEQTTGVCRAYCCGETELCAPGTYCAPRPMAEAGDPNVVIPTCIDADDCTLLATGQCPEGTGCFVVRGDGTTACIPPGEGKQGQACPCAEGYACTKLDDECFKICHTEPVNTEAECDAGYSCQGNVATLPDGFGLCISNF